MAKHNAKTMALLMVMELIIVAAKVDNKVGVGAEFSIQCTTFCGATCGDETSWARLYCFSGCLVQCVDPSADRSVLDCVGSCAVSECPQFENPGDTDKLEECINANCIKGCLPKA